MKKIVFGDFVEYYYPFAKLGNYHICNLFADNGYEALCVTNTFNELIRLKDKWDYDHKKSISKPIRHRLNSNIYGFAPWSWRLYGDYPFCRNPKIITKMSSTIWPNIWKSMNKLGFEHVDVLWISNPKLFWLADVIKYDKLVYRIADDYVQFRDFPNIEELEADFIRKADHIFITSYLFTEKVMRLGKKPVLLNNAVDTKSFLKEQPVPAEYLDLARKKVVYVGAIRYWFDVELLAKLAENVDADIYLIGPEMEKLDRIRKYSNVHILGARKYESVPAYMQNADVSIIPFVTGDLTAAISPLKLFEYCASGTPVVSTHIEEVVKMNAPIYIAQDHNDFIIGVQRALDLPKPSQVLKDYAARNSWSERFNTIIEEFGREIQRSDSNRLVAF